LFFGLFCEPALTFPKTIDKPSMSMVSHKTIHSMAMVGLEKTIQKPLIPKHYGTRADILKKAIRKCLTLKIDFSANFNLTRDFWAEALSTPQKLEIAKMNLQISI